MLDPERKEASLEEFKEEYRKKRVAGQIVYFLKHAAQSTAEALRYRITIWTCVGLAASVDGYGFSLPTTRLKIWARDPISNFFELGASIGFQIATVAGALLAVNDCDRRRQRYRELHHLLGEWDAQLRKFCEPGRVFCRLPEELSARCWRN